MKNRRLVLVAFLLCASILVGVGYAAVITSLNIDGKASFTFGEVHEYAEEIHFTGITKVVNYDHVELPDQQAIIAATQNGKQTAVLSASFSSENKGDFLDDAADYTAGVIYEIELVCPDGAGSMTVTFAAHPEVIGNVGTGTVATKDTFVVTSHLKAQGDDDGADVTTIEVTEGTPVILELHVRLVMSGDTVADVADTDFEVVLPVTGVEFAVDPNA